MNESERQDWLKTLRPGDTVAVESSFGGTCSWEKALIFRVTPTGRIKLADDRDFGKSGYYRSGGTWSTISLQLVPWSDDFQNTMDRRKLERTTLHYLRHDAIDPEKVKALTDGQLVELRAMLRKFKVDKVDT